MSGEEEVLCNKNDLCKHLNDLGYDDFETYESYEQYHLDDNSRSKDFAGRPTSLPHNSLKSNLTSELTQIDSHNHDMIMSLLRSKLLFLEDVNFVESVLSFCYIYDKNSVSYMIGAVATSFISVAAYFNRGIDSYLPLSCFAMSSIYAAWKLYKDISELNRNKSLTLCVKSLQNLCIDFHKVLRFLKEVEILSTGQVSTQNVGSAMFIPCNSVSGLDELSPWKTFPDLRKSVADSLIDVINIFSCGCDYLSRFSPSWMDIKGFSSNSQSSLNQMKVTIEDISTYHGCISIKDLQILNDNYLIAQSEFLKWVAFYLCPVVWKNSKVSFATFKSVTLIKYLENIQSKIFDISLKLKISFDLQKIFTCPETKDPLQKLHPEARVPPNVVLKDLKELQVELHNIFLLVLSTVQKAKSLEDCLDKFASNITEEKCVPVDDLKDNLSGQLSVVRNDLAQVVKDYDYIYSQILNKNKCTSYEDKSVETENTAYQHKNDNSEIIKVGHSDFTVSSPDEVFLAISGLKPEDFDISPDDWCMEKKPKIPQTLLIELSTTLKPIRKDFEERERLVLQKLGIEDIEMSNIEEEIAKKPILNQTNPLNLTKGSTPCFSYKSDHDEIESEESTEFTKNINVPSEPVHTANSLLMANLLKANLLAKQRKNLEEECFSND